MSFQTRELLKQHQEREHCENKDNKDNLEAHFAHMHESQTSQQSFSLTPTIETEATIINYEFDDQSGSLTDLINFQPLVEGEEFYSSSTTTDPIYHDHHHQPVDHHTTQLPDIPDQDGSRVIDPFFDPAPVSCSSVTVSTPGEEPMFTVVSNLNNKMIMSELESLSQYKSTVVRAEMPYNTQVSH